MKRPRFVAVIGGLSTLMLVFGLGLRQASAQGPTIDTGEPEGPGGERSSLGDSPGGGGSMLGSAPGASGSVFGEGGGAILGGRAGPSFPRVPTALTAQAGATAIPEQRGIAAPAAAPITEVPLTGTLALPPQLEDLGPPGALTLDQAIERLLRDNIDLRSKFMELPQADADILTASLRANPIFYADTQLVPYGQYSNTRPGGPLQYDVNITHPFDVNHKRQARMLVARRARRVLEAQYQDAVRVQIDNLYTAFVDVLAARQRLAFAQTSLKGNQAGFEQVKGLLVGGERTPADVSRLSIQLNRAAIGVVDAENQLKVARQSLGRLLNIPAAETERLEVYGTIFDKAPPPPAAEELVRIGLTFRPDLASWRLGVQRAEADVRLSKANRFQDVYVLYQPYTFQNNQPFGTKSAMSWALGVTVPLPLYNRNQGVIERAKLNVTQTKMELSSQELQVINDVVQADREYRVSREAVRRVERTILPAARYVLEDSQRLYRSQQIDTLEYLDRMREYNETVQQYLDTVVRHRRSMLDLNTAVGYRLLP